MSNLGDEVTAFAVVSALILKPLSITLYASNLLTIVVRNRVGDGVGGGINTVLADAVEEFFLFLNEKKMNVRYQFPNGTLYTTSSTYNCNRRLKPTIDQSPDTITDHRASQPSNSTTGSRRHTENNEWIQTHNLST